MRVLFFQLVGGASGDMLLSALHGLGVNFSDFAAALRRMEHGIHLKFPRIAVSGITGWQLRTSGVDSARWRRKDLPRWLQSIPLSARSRRAARKTVDLLVQAEARVHGVSTVKVHLHEIGRVDTLVDVLGYFYGLERLDIDEVFFSEVPAGKGIVKGSHGDLPNPPPAVAQLMSGLKTEWRETESELVTPTALALLKTSGRQQAPPFVVEKTAFAFGTRKSVRESSLRAFLGVRATDAETLILLETNVDDITPERCAFAMEELLRAGARDALAMSALMKKGRPGWTIQAWVTAETEEAVAESLVRETGTLGFRRQEVSRVALPRKLRRVTTKFGALQVKIGFWRNSVMSVKPEYEECAEAARKYGVPLSEVIAEAHDAARRGFDED
jgi:uncharacterized protein (TIGR00299 family) protein